MKMSSKEWTWNNKSIEKGIINKWEDSITTKK